MTDADHLPVVTDPVDQVAAQLRNDLGSIAFRVGFLAGLDAAAEWERTIRGHCDRIARAMHSSDEGEAADAVVAVMGAMWFFADPEMCGLAGWWETPLGRACARFFGPDHDDAHETKRWRLVPNQPEPSWPSSDVDDLAYPPEDG